MYILFILLLVFILIIWKIISDFSILWLAIPAALVVIFFSFFLKDESRLGGFATMLLGIALMVLGIIYRDVTLEAFTDKIPELILFWK